MEAKPYNQKNRENWQGHSMRLTREELEIYLMRIAHFLGGWNVDRRNEHHLYLMGEGMKILVRDQSHRQSERGRLFFIGVMPNGYTGSRESHTITASFLRQPKAVANDIKKRLLIALKKDTNAAHEWLALNQIDANELDQIASIVRNIGFESVHNGHNDRSYLRTIYGKTKKVELKFEVGKKYRSTLTVSNVSAEKLIKIAYFIHSL